MENRQKLRSVGVLQKSARELGEVAAIKLLAKIIQKVSKLIMVKTTS